LTVTPWGIGIGFFPIRDIGLMLLAFRSWRESFALAARSSWPLLPAFARCLLQLIAKGQQPRAVYQ
jgi:hypothetical protein